MPEQEILRQVTTKRARSCDTCVHYMLCEFYNIWSESGTSAELAVICKYAEQIIIQEDKTK